ncbi:MAG: DUF1254 domain-containing protein [Pirellula sp.]
MAKGLFLLGIFLLATPSAFSQITPIHLGSNNEQWRENYAYSLAWQAYLFGYPYVNHVAYRHNFIAGPYVNDMIPYMATNQFFHWRKLPDAKYKGAGGTNNDTPYSMAFVDLSKEPVILSHPDMGDRYFYFQLAQCDNDNFAAVGKRTTGSKAGNFALVGPKWEGTLPDDVKALPRSQTSLVFIMGRTLMKDNGPDALEVNQLQDQYKLTPLSYWGKKEAYVPQNHDVWKPYDIKTDPLAEYKTMNRAMAEFGVDPRYKNYLGLFATIGVGPGLDPEELDEATKRGLARAAKDAMNFMIEMNKSSRPFMGVSKDGWDISDKNFGKCGRENDFMRRASICFAGFVSPEKEEATYYQSNTDVAGNLYDGSKNYSLHFAPGTLPDVKDFWSITMYSMATGVFNLVDNPINRYSLGDRSPGLKYDADGGLTIYIGPISPGGDKESNWLPSAPSGPYTLTFRTYGAGKDILDQKWFPPGLQPAK